MFCQVGAGRPRDSRLAGAGGGAHRLACCFTANGSQPCSKLASHAHWPHNFIIPNRVSGSCARSTRRLQPCGPLHDAVAARGGREPGACYARPGGQRRQRAQGPGRRVWRHAAVSVCGHGGLRRGRRLLCPAAAQPRRGAAAAGESSMGVPGGHAGKQLAVGRLGCARSHSQCAVCPQSQK